jgi:hypothetical protein
VKADKTDELAIKGAAAGKNLIAMYGTAFARLCG